MQHPSALPSVASESMQVRIRAPGLDCLLLSPHSAELSVGNSFNNMKIKSLQILRH